VEPTVTDQPVETVSEDPADPSGLAASALTRRGFLRAAGLTGMPLAVA
jgi:hypothetical protein